MQEAIYGFGNINDAATTTIGKVNGEIEVDGVKGKSGEILIVSDEAQPVELIIGRTWTEQPQIAYMKKGDTLHIGYAHDDPFRDIMVTEKEKVVLKAEEDISLRRRSVQFVKVKTDSGTTSDIVIRSGKDEIGQLHRMEHGRAEVPIINFNDTDTIIKQGDIIGRAELVTAEEDDNDRTEISSTVAPIESHMINVDSDVTEEQKNELTVMLNEYRDCFAFNLQELGCTNLVEMDIEEVESSQPFNAKPYRVSRDDRETIKQIVAEWKSTGIVSDTKSPYASPVLLVRKKNGEARLVVDLRRLNKQTVKQVYPVPKIDEQLELLSGSEIFSVLDLAHGYLQIPLSENAKKKTGFITPDDRGQFDRMIFGLSNAPYEFARLMHIALGDLKDKIAMCYMDDILIPATDWSEMMQRVRLILEALRKAKLTLKLRKCEFGKREIEYLGFVITREGIRPGKNKIAAVDAFPTPTNVHEVKRFLGLTGFFRRFVLRYATLAEPLSRLTRKSERFEWTEKQEKAFGALKKALTTEPVLALYDPKARTELHTDASAEGLAGMLLQEGREGRMHLVYCVSKKTTEAERHYHSSKLELMAVVWSLDRLRQFLIGITFEVITDCQALVYLNAAKTTNSQIARWFSLIQEFNMTVRYRSGQKMGHVDALSRGPTGTESDTMNEMLERKLEVCLTLMETEQVATMQHSDDELKGKISILKKPEEQRTEAEKQFVKELVLERNVLYRRIPEEDHYRYLYVIPRAMRKSMVVRFHDMNGHFGLDRTVSRLQERYWFPRMRRYVRGHIKACFECLVNKVPAGRQAGLLHPIPSGKRPFEVIHLDHLGPFVTSTKKNKYLLVLIDNLTKFVKLYAVRDTTTKKVLQSLRKFEGELGLPEVIITDRGTCFTAKDFENHCQENGVRHVLNSSRHPQANGQVERVNRTILPVIVTAMENPEQKDWDGKIDKIERDLNTAPNKTTGKSPFELLHGYKPRFNDGILRYLEHEENTQWNNPEELQEKARETIQTEQQKYKARYDQGHYPAQRYDKGEVVVMKRAIVSTGEPTKTQARYRGPLLVTEVLPSDTYRVAQLLPENGRHYATTAHASQIKNWRCPESEEDEPNNEEDESKNQSDEPKTDEPENESEEPKTKDDVPERGEQPNDKEEASQMPLPEAESAGAEDVTTARPKRDRRPPRYLNDYV